MCDRCSKSAQDRIAPSRRSAMLLAASALSLVFANRVLAKETKAPPKPQNVLSPDAALKRLIEGNARYVDGVSRRHDFKHEREVLVGGQNPFAAVLSCATRASRRNTPSTLAAAISSSAALPAILPALRPSPAWNIRWPCWARR